MRARLGLLSATVLTLAACTAGGGGPDTPADDDAVQPFTDEVMLVSSLVSFDACDDLLSYVKEHALEMVGPGGLGGDGVEDQLVKVDYIRSLKIPTLWHDAVQIIEGAGHAPHWERPQRFNALLADFVADVSS